MNIAILGSGFGLYGYLPSVMSIGCGRVLLPTRYRPVVDARADIRDFVERIEWHKDEEAILNRVDTVIIARRPADQVFWATNCAERGHIRRILLEKPLAPSPADAVRLLEFVERTGKIVRVAYTFRYTSWGRRFGVLARCAGPEATIELDWSFRAHHYAFGLANWKRFVSSGGGAIRFYGIHLVALLGEIGYDTVMEF